MILFEDDEIILFPESLGSEPWTEKFLTAWKDDWKRGVSKMAKELRTTKRPDGTGFSEIVTNGERSVSIHWRGDSGAAPSDVIRLTLNRLEDEQRGGPFADPRNAKAIVLLMQAEQELNGTQANVDGVPVIGE